MSSHDNECSFSSFVKYNGSKIFLMNIEKQKNVKRYYKESIMRDNKKKENNVYALRHFQSISIILASQLTSGVFT
jgi:hypothetical protein